MEHQIGSGQAGRTIGPGDQSSGTDALLTPIYMQPASMHYLIEPTSIFAI
jgi:hypothetical protein